MVGQLPAAGRTIDRPSGPQSRHVCSIIFPVVDESVSLVELFAEFRVARQPAKPSPHTERAARADFTAIHAHLQETLGSEVVTLDSAPECSEEGWSTPCATPSPPASPRTGASAIEDPGPARAREPEHGRRATSTPPPTRPARRPGPTGPTRPSDNSRSADARQRHEQIAGSSGA